MNPYLIIAAGLIWLASVTGAYLKGGADKEARMEVQIAAERHAAFMEGRARQLKSDRETLGISAGYHTVSVNIIRRTQTTIKEIPTYVQDNATCVTVGLVRVLDAAALGTNPDLLSLAPGESDGACAGIGAYALAESVIGNYGRAHENAAKLTALQAWVDTQLSIINGGADGNARPLH